MHTHDNVNIVNKDNTEYRIPHPAHKYGFKFFFSTGRNKIPVIELILGPGQRVNNEVYWCHGVNPKSHTNVWKMWELLFVRLLYIWIHRNRLMAKNLEFRSQPLHPHAAILTLPSFFSVCWLVHMQALRWLDPDHKQEMC